MPMTHMSHCPGHMGEVLVLQRTGAKHKTPLTASTTPMAAYSSKALGDPYCQRPLNSCFTLHSPRAQKTVASRRFFMFLPPGTPGEAMGLCWAANACLAASSFIRRFLA